MSTSASSAPPPLTFAAPRVLVLVVPLDVPREGQQSSLRSAEAVDISQIGGVATTMAMALGPLVSAAGGKAAFTEA